MTLFHGTDCIENKKSILKNGFNYSSKNCTFGDGIYATTSFDIAYDYTESNNFTNLKRDKRRIITFEIDNSQILSLKYDELTCILGLSSEQCNWENSLEHLGEIKNYVLNRGFKAIKVDYLDCSEVCIYDKSIIKNMK